MKTVCRADDLTNVASALEQEIEVQDRALQGIYGISLGLERTLHLLDESDAEAKAGIQTAITRLHAIIADLRAHIHERSKLARLVHAGEDRTDA